MSRKSSTVETDVASFTGALLEMVRVIQFRDRERACCYGVSVSQCYGLHALCEEPGLSLNGLAARLYLEKSTASRLVQSLEDLGFATKEPDPEDRRTVRVWPSRRGQAVHRAILDDLHADASALLRGLDSKTRAAVTEVVRRLGRGFADGVEAGGGTCCVVR